ncbi:unnamed protein product [Cyclocybe aegerita]|uniref:Uncharacterized protein n=1 Tax=Cyclocybe aegerita TaxID=1973307 RepID=A0A8S0WV32_CYCAE|nr:unnamed protein product [Cyclocybe aegerita]
MRGERTVVERYTLVTQTEASARTCIEAIFFRAVAMLLSSSFAEQEQGKQLVLGLELSVSATVGQAVLKGFTDYTILKAGKTHAGEIIFAHRLTDERSRKGRERIRRVRAALSAWKPSHPLTLKFLRLFLPRSAQDTLISTLYPLQPLHHPRRFRPKFVRPQPSIGPTETVAYDTQLEPGGNRRDDNVACASDFLGPSSILFNLLKPRLRAP